MLRRLPGQPPSRHTFPRRSERFPRLARKSRAAAAKPRPRAVVAPRAVALAEQSVLADEQKCVAQCDLAAARFRLGVVRVSETGLAERWQNRATSATRRSRPPPGSSSPGCSPWAAAPKPSSSTAGPCPAPAPSWPWRPAARSGPGSGCPGQPGRCAGPGARIHRSGPLRRRRTSREEPQRALCGRPPNAPCRRPPRQRIAWALNPQRVARWRPGDAGGPAQPASGRSPVEA